ncbi:MAG: ABC transporter substrate-binding protein [Paracoccus denitrificans]|nr:MAG: ABC transporter substrate-binding protein [Paracoccus denitrificans]PZO86313.1 MAG: ABC transporter substrate-binding protein [Paracoccus denitrificans]
MKHLTLAALMLAGTALAGWAQDTPQDGGVLNFTAPYGTSISTFDIHASPSAQDEIVSHAIHRSLYKWNPQTNKPELDLASDVKVSDDGLTYTYTLRDNVVFHNDKPLTVDDIIFTYNRLADPKKALAGQEHIAEIKGMAEVQAGSATELSGLKKIDDKTLEITFSQPIDPGFSLMSNYAAIYPSNVPEEQQATKPVGLGPFKFVENVPGSRATVEKFDKYYVEGKPHLQTINFLPMGEAAARDVAFRNGEIDFSVLGPTQFQEYQADPALAKDLLEVPEVYTRIMGFNLDNEKFKDVRVRQAINHAINTPLIIDKLVKGKAYQAVGFLPTSSPAFDKDAKPYDYDPEKAKALLAEAGFPDGIDFAVTAIPNESWGLTIAEAIIPMLARSNIRLTTRPVENATLADTIQKGDFEAFMWSLSSGPDPLKIMLCFDSTTPRASCNYTDFKNEDYDKVYAAAQAERDEAKRNDLLKQADAIVREQAPMWFFNYNKAVVAHQPWVHGLQQNAQELGIQDYEDIWIDDTAPANRRD